MQVATSGGYETRVRFLCQIIEWGGFALASWNAAAMLFWVNTMANLVPRCAHGHATHHTIAMGWHDVFQFHSWCSSSSSSPSTSSSFPSSSFSSSSSSSPSTSSSYVPRFVVDELPTMLRRAIRAHHRARAQFGGRYPAERKAVFPFLL